MTKASILSDKIIKGKQVLEKSEEMIYFMNFVNHFIIIINDENEILHINNPLLDFLKINTESSFLGSRLNQFIKCMNFEEAFEKDEYSRSLKDPILDKLINLCKNRNGEVKESCKILLNNDKIIESKISAVPLLISEHLYIIITIEDISELKWRETVERIFFHDILNSAGALTECLNMLDSHYINSDEDLLSISKKISKNLIEEITSHRQFLMAERGEYIPNITTFDSNDILSEVSDKARYSFLSEDKNFYVLENNHVYISSDRTLLSRVIFNLVKNAFEATKKEGTVEIYSRIMDNNIQFVIKNSGFIPTEIQPQIFQKAFSTKGSGRGLGTYSAKFISEKFLGGDVSFESDELYGTIFYAEYPITIR